jgi:hypothetical protein
MFQEEMLEKVVENGPEVLVYFMINHIGSFQWRMNHSMMHGRITEGHAEIHEDMQRGHEQQKQLIRSLPKYGVAKPLEDDDKPTGEYWKWFRWWNDWAQHTLTRDEWEAIEGEIQLDMTEEQIARCRPPGDWRE